jgi:hypothetical protein
VIHTTIKIPDELNALRKRLNDDAAMLRTLVPIMDGENEVTIAEIKEKRLSQKGPETLGVVRGRLRESITQAHPVVIGNRVVSAIGSNVKYLRPHEFGMDEDVNVGPYMRKRKAKEIIFGRRRVVRKGDVMVRAHKRHMKFPERAPLRRGILARTESYKEALGNGVVKFYAGK